MLKNHIMADKDKANFNRIPVPVVKKGAHVKHETIDLPFKRPTQKVIVIVN